jgi:hypothetical protein
METSDVKGLEDKEAKHVDIAENSNVKSKILNVRNPKTLNPKPFHKGKDLFIPYGDHLAIPKGVESLENLVKLAKRKEYEGMKSINFTKAKGMHVIHSNKLLWYGN